MQKRFILILCLLAVTAFIIRMAAGIELLNYNGGRNDVNTPSALTDMGTYMSLSNLVARGEFNSPFYYQPFYYAVFLPILKVLFGDLVWIIIAAQAVLGALTVYIAGLSAARLGGKNSGIICATLLTFCGILILYTPFHLIVTLQTFWLVLLFFLCIQAIKKRNWKRWALVGLVYGCAILTRGNVWLFFPGLLAAALLSQFKDRKKEHKLSPGAILKRFIPVLSFIIFLTLPQLPFMVYNTQKLGKLSPPSSAAQNVLALGNTPESPPGGREVHMGAGAMEYPETYSLWTGDETPVQTHIWNWFVNEPAAFIELTFRKLLLFWDRHELPNNISYEAHGSLSTTLSLFGFMESWVFIALGLAGIVCLYRLLRRKLEFQLLTYLIVAYWFSIAAFYILSRFRAPILPLLAIYAGVLAGYYIRIRKKHFERAYYFCFPMVFLFFCVSFFAYDFYRFNIEADMMCLVRPHGTVVAQGDGRYMITEAGPFTFGGWNYVPFQPGVNVIKNFSGLKNKDYKSVELEVVVLWETPGKAEFRINGYRQSVINTQRGFTRERFLLPFPQNGRFVIQLESATTRVFYYIDVQRDYGRTQIGDIFPPGELVCRLYCSPEDFNVIREQRRKQEQPEQQDKKKWTPEQESGAESNPDAVALYTKLFPAKP